jgi:3-oxoacyl-[acyl-carrier-protein] synthase II
MAKMIKERILISGIGAVAPFGVGIDAFRRGLREGAIAVRPVTRFDVSPFYCTVGGYDPDFDATKYLGAREVKETDPFQQIGILAADEAIRDAGVAPPSAMSPPGTTPEPAGAYEPARLGIVGGASHGGVSSAADEFRRIYDKGITWVSPYFAPKTTINHLAGRLALRLGWTGANLSVANSCATGISAIAAAAMMIRCGYCDAALAVASEVCVTPEIFAVFSRVRALARPSTVAPERALKPFDRNRSGTVLADGAGALFLEREDAAIARGANVYGIVAGFGASNDAYHPVAPDPEGNGARLSMEMALADAGLTPADLDHIQAHATATPFNDVMEAKAIRAVFGDEADRITVGAIKCQMGHTIGGAGALEAVAACLSLRDSFLPGIVTLDEPDPACDLNFVRAPRPATTPPRAILINSFGFGGHNASLILARP